MIKCRRGAAEPPVERVHVRVYIPNCLPNRCAVPMNRQKSFVAPIKWKDSLELSTPHAISFGHSSGRKLRYWRQRDVSMCHSSLLIIFLSIKSRIRGNFYALLIILPHIYKIGHALACLFIPVILVNENELWAIADKNVYFEWISNLTLNNLKVQAYFYDDARVS